VLNAYTCCIILYSQRCFGCLAQSRITPKKNIVYECIFGSYTCEGYVFIPVYEVALLIITLPPGRTEEERKVF